MNEHKQARQEVLALILPNGVTVKDRLIKILTLSLINKGIGYDLFKEIDILEHFIERNGYTVSVAELMMEF